VFLFYSDSRKKYFHKRSHLNVRFIIEIYFFVIVVSIGQVLIELAYFFRFLQFECCLLMIERMRIYSEQT